ncbi:MAG: hypothetical protein MI749_06430, partial [Desulfovibrionales bacterium]|nr:hypothetical protein [Desulfovibrionales bacterium]
MRLILRLFLVLRYLFHRLTGTGSFSPGHRVDFITGPHGSRANPVKAGLHHFHVKQFHESSCSVASMVSVINTLARIQGIETK